MMYQGLWRQRWRFAIVAILAAWSGYLLGPNAPIESAAIFTTGYTGALFLALGLHPTQRYRVTSAAVATLFVAMICLAGSLQALAPLLVIFTIMGCFMLPARLTWLNRIRLPWAVTFHAGRSLNVPAGVLWNRLFPAPTYIHWDPRLCGILPGAEPDVMVYVYDADGYESRAHVPFRLVDVDMGRSFKLHDCSPAIEGEIGSGSMAHYTILRRGNASMLEMHETAWRPGLWTAVNSWLDDYLGEEIDRLAGLLEGASETTPYAPRLVEL